MAIIAKKLTAKPVYALANVDEGDVKSVNGITPDKKGNVDLGN